MRRLAESRAPSITANRQRLAVRGLRIGFLKAGRLAESVLAATVVLLIAFAVAPKRIAAFRAKQSYFSAKVEKFAGELTCARFAMRARSAQQRSWWMPLNSRKVNRRALTAPDTFLSRLAPKTGAEKGRRDKAGLHQPKIKPEVWGGKSGAAQRKEFMTDSAPKRIQRRRTKGWKMPPNTVYVGRPSMWGNPMKVGIFKNYSRADAVNDFRRWMDCEPSTWAFNRGINPPTINEIKHILGGKDLACWCPLVDKDGNHVPCHADVLLEIANSEAKCQTE